MDRKNLQLLKMKPYRVSWKADGTRCMLLRMYVGVKSALLDTQVHHVHPRQGRGVPTGSRQLSVCMCRSDLSSTFPGTAHIRHTIGWGMWHTDLAGHVRLPLCPPTSDRNLWRIGYPMVYGLVIWSMTSCSCVGVRTLQGVTMPPDCSTSRERSWFPETLL